MKKFVIAGVAAMALLAGGWIYRQRSQPPVFPFAKVKRETLISTLPTNGKVEPMEWQPIRAVMGGLVDRLPVQEGQAVGAGVLIAILRAGDSASELASAEARIASAHAELAVIERGGSSAELAVIRNSLQRARFDKANAERDLATLGRLAEKQAATRFQVEEARQRVRQAELEIESLEHKRKALVTSADRTVAEARLREAQSAAELARRRLAQAEVRAPMAGVIYGLAVRPGAFVHPGDLIANVGRLDRLRVRVYVDEPELGRLAVGQPVTLTWDALPGATWQGSVEKLPVEIVPLGTRQVGEVRFAIENTDGKLGVGANVSAEIRTQVAENAITIPKEALRREGAEAGVLVLKNDHLAWQKVTTGASSVTRAQVTSGLSEGDAVLLPTERAVQAGDEVRATYP